MSSRDIIAAYYDAFNRQALDIFFDLLSDDVVHDLNQGARQFGKPAFREFMAHMNRCYRERLEDIVIMANEDGTRGAAEFTVHGTYLHTDDGLPDASGQTYTLPAGTFFELANGKITRVTTYYNLQDWIDQVSTSQ